MHGLPQVSGLTFNFDGQQPAGSRVLPGSVRVAGRPLELEQKYKVCCCCCHCGDILHPHLRISTGSPCCASRVPPLREAPACLPWPTLRQVATKAYLRGGKDGFESLKNSRVRQLCRAVHAADE